MLKLLYRENLNYKIVLSEDVETKGIYLVIT